MIGPARVAAYDILLAVSAGRADLPTAVAHARSALKDERDRALASEIATGVQRWRAALDHVIARVAKRSLDRLDPEIVEILRLSGYQLLYLSRVPAANLLSSGTSRRLITMLRPITACSDALAKWNQNRYCA